MTETGPSDGFWPHREDERPSPVSEAGWLRLDIAGNAAALARLFGRDVLPRR